MCGTEGQMSKLCFSKKGLVVCNSVKIMEPDGKQHRMNLTGSYRKGYSQHLQYLVLLPPCKVPPWQTRPWYEVINHSCFLHKALLFPGHRWSRWFMKRNSFLWGHRCPLACWISSKLGASKRPCWAYHALCSANWWTPIGNPCIAWFLLFSV